MLQNKIQLITYPNSLGKNLKDLHKIINQYFSKIIGGVHILPFYPSSADRGFSPLTHLEVEKQFGTWDDIRAISKEYDFICDLMVNHISSRSLYFQDYLKKGEKSKYKNYFITDDKFLGAKRLKLSDITKIYQKIYRPRPGIPFCDFELGDGGVKKIWTTFSRDQIDIDTNNPEVKTLLKTFIKKLSKNGVKLIRLDAVGYAVKKRGTNCFMIPETLKFIDWIGKIADENKVNLLPEVHYNYKYQEKLCGCRGTDFTYDFALPMLVLNAIFCANAHNFKYWLKIRPANQITVLDTHDGIGVVDVDGLMNEKEINETVRIIHLHGGNNSMRASGKNSDNLDIYQINSTYYSALGENDDAYIAARALQYFVPGIPQIYYVGLLAGKNDIALLEKTNHGRDINRHSYKLSEIKSELKRPVVKRLFRLNEFRNTYPAFNGKFELLDSKINEIIMSWTLNNWYCQIKVNLINYNTILEYKDLKTRENKMIKL